MPRVDLFKFIQNDSEQRLQLHARTISTFHYPFMLRGFGRTFLFLRVNSAQFVVRVYCSRRRRVRECVVGILLLAIDRMPTFDWVFLLVRSNQAPIHVKWINLDQKLLSIR